MKTLLLIPILFFLVIPVSALELEAPPVPEAAEEWMPGNTASFGAGLTELAEKLLTLLYPEVQEAAKVCLSVLAAAMLLAVVKLFSGMEGGMVRLAGAVAPAMLLFGSSNVLIQLSSETIRELIDYGKLLFPVMSAALAAQGGVSTSAALYAGTTIFDLFLGSLLTNLLIPLIYLFLSLSVGYAATGEGFLKRLKELIKSICVWCLKTTVTVFTAYMSITGVISGTTDAAALKATRMTISTAVPVVGGILSDASEAVLVSAGLLKNATGIYGILAILAVLLEPFVRIGVQYLLLKFTAALCVVFSEGSFADLTEDFSSGMGLLLAITGSVCLMLLVSTVCFMKGVG